jgi:hypothetical protein
VKPGIVRVPGNLSKDLAIGTLQGDSHMSTYDTDYGLWLAEQINHIKSHQWEQLDADNLIAELEQLNRSNKRELYSYLVVVLGHLLKWQYQPQDKSGSWRGSIKNGRKRIERLFKDQPSLKPYVTEILAEAYTEASELASDETGKPLSVFPLECPYSLVQVLGADFFPEEDI